MRFEEGECLRGVERERSGDGSVEHGESCGAAAAAGAAADAAGAAGAAAGVAAGAAAAGGSCDAGKGAIAGFWFPGQCEALETEEFRSHCRGLSRRPENAWNLVSVALEGFALEAFSLCGRPGVMPRGREIAFFLGVDCIGKVDVFGDY